jgi:hypothetical protein
VRGERRRSREAKNSRIQKLQEFRRQPNHVANKSARFVVGLSTVSVMFSRRRRRVPFELLASRLLEFLASRLLHLSPFTSHLSPFSSHQSPLRYARAQRARLSIVHLAVNPDALQDTQGKKHQDEERTTVADHRQGDAGNWRNRDRHPDIHINMSK